ncbi:hypothetical protein L3X38_030538 [Prunus dulcis]|uniref:Uncharacterized protein n=1 Tax=Prunus dulcis TaxID=3755 RepID=A0AAD4VCL4_PRUDU|nr:hypothetical protein L3X38_030538 [Prunus dulcis]
MDILNMPSKKLKQQPSYFKMTKPEQKPSLMGIRGIQGYSYTSVTLKKIATVIPAKLQRQNYFFWKLLFEQIFSRSKLMGIIDGSEPCPAQFLTDKEGNDLTDQINPAFEIWHDKDQAMLTWMRSTCSEHEKPGAAALATTDICDAHPDLLASGDLRLVPQVFQKYGKWQAFAGPVVTLKVFEDNTLVIELLSTKGEGRVLVVDGGGSMRRAVTGGMLARSAEIMGWVWPKACSCKYWRGLDSRGRMVVCGWRWHPCLLIRTVYLNPN